MLSIYLIRHLPTEGNLQYRYIGRTDEPLCQQGITQADNFSYPPVELLFTSPLKRCVQTASLFFPNQVPIIVSDLQETHFGEFEGKNYKELRDNQDYQAWIDSNGALSFPNGESPEKFKQRSRLAFEHCMKQALQTNATSIGFVVHGGTIMSIMEYLFSVPTYISNLWAFLYPQRPFNENEIILKYANETISFPCACRMTYYDWHIKNGECYEIHISKDCQPSQPCDE